MSNQPIDKQKLTDSILKASGGKIDRSALNAAARGDASALLGALGADDRRRLTKLLNDPKALERLMNDEATRKLIDGLSGGGKNG